MNIKKGDTVKIMTGKDRGKTGKVLQVLSGASRLVVEELNIMTKNVRARREREKGQRIKFASPVDASNVQLVCPKCGQVTRIGTHLDGEKKHRQCVKCHATID